MNSPSNSLRRILIHFPPLALLVMPIALSGEPPSRATGAFDAYERRVESRLAVQHSSPHSFLATPNGDPRGISVRPGAPILERLTPVRTPQPDGALLEHWRGTSFVAGAAAADFEQILRDVQGYPRYFAPQVASASATSGGTNGGTVVSMRLRQQHVLAVVLDATYDVCIKRLDSQHGYSTSRSRQIHEIADPGTAREHVPGPEAEHGWLWRMNTYWSYEERDGGLYLQIETITLSRAVPNGLGWLISPYVESIPRDSMSFTLQAASNALRSRMAATQMRNLK